MPSPFILETCYLISQIASSSSNIVVQCKCKINKWRKLKKKKKKKSTVCKVAGDVHDTMETISKETSSSVHKDDNDSTLSPECVEMFNKDKNSSSLHVDSSSSCKGADPSKGLFFTQWQEQLKITT